MKKAIVSLLRRVMGTQQINEKVECILAMTRLNNQARGDALAQNGVASERIDPRSSASDAALTNAIMTMVRSEYTVMPRFCYHQPMDYSEVTLPPIFDEVETCSETGMKIPTGADRFGYSPKDTKEYLEWGRYDHDQITSVIKKHRGTETQNWSILDFGCSSGRVLRHFENEHRSMNWKLYGCDVQAKAVEWMRQHLPQHFNVISNSILPHLPFEDRAFDCIYGFSVFTHIKYQWDFWLMELRRVLKPGGLLIQTIHTETAWEHYYQHRKEDWVIGGHSPRVYNTPKMDVDYLLHGDASVSQVFWKKEVAERFWGRYLKVLERLEPPKYSFQDWMICERQG